MRRIVARVPLLETGLIALALIVLVTLAVLGQRAEQTPPLDSYSSYDAASGGYRALYETLGRLGVRVERFERRPALLDDSTDTLVYAEPLAFDPRQIPTTKNDAQAIEAWVREGGRLVYIGHDDRAAKAKLLALPFSRPASTARGAPFIAPSLRAAGVNEIGPVSWPQRWALPHPKAELLVRDGDGALVVRYPFGRGTVTAVIDESLFANANLARADRARLAYALLSPGKPGGVVSFYETVHGYLIAEHWWSVVPRPFVIALAIALVALLAALAGAAVRLGPPIVPRPRDDRTSADFIDAVSTLLERGGAARATMQDAERSTAHAIARSFGLQADAPPNEIAEHIENPQTRDAFLTLVRAAETGSATSENVVRTVALAQRLRKEYQPHGRQRY